MDISSLIKDITPLYNQYKQNNRLISGSEALEIMWDIGSLLKEFLENNDIAPHALYREIYGKGEGSSNISRKSWVTREFQGRCFRIRNMFDTKETISKEFSGLKSFTLFRESMPFLDNDKYKLIGGEREDLLALLNSNKTNKFILSEIKKLQSKKIGIKNSRKQRLNELEDEEKIFIEFYNYIYRLSNEDQGLDILVEDKVSDSLIKEIANNTSALSSDGLKFIGFKERIDLDNSIWNDYIGVIKGFYSQTNPKKIRRFRRIVPPERIVNLSDMLYQILRIKNNESRRQDKV